MYAIIRDRGKQYKVSEGELVHFDRLPEGSGKDVTFPDVLYFENGKDVRVGKPTVPNVKVTGQVVRELLKGPKVIAIMFRKRESFRRKKGMRACFSVVKIGKIEA
ncbi:MAG: 50S ribosomal protein L21 [Planctomycetota bacterium]